MVVFLNSELDKYANEVLLPEMRKSIIQIPQLKKRIIGEVTGFDRDDKIRSL